MSRNSLIRPRRYRAVSDRPATGTRLFPSPFPPNIPHYKRCPKAHRLRLRSDQSLSLPVYVTGYGRFPDKKRLALSKGQCQVRAALNRRIRFASSGDALEHSVMSPPRAIVPPWAIAPCSDSHGLDLPASPNSRMSADSKPTHHFWTPPSQPLPASPNSRMSADSKPTHHFWIPPSSQPENFRLRTPVTGPRSHPLGWSSASGGRDRPTARFPRFSSTSSQKHGAVAKPASMSNIRCRGKRPSVQA